MKESQQKKRRTWRCFGCSESKQGVHYGCASCKIADLCHRCVHSDVHQDHAYVKMDAYEKTLKQMETINNNNDDGNNNNNNNSNKKKNSNAALASINNPPIAQLGVDEEAPKNAAQSPLKPLRDPNYDSKQNNNIGKNSSNGNRGYDIDVEEEEGDDDGYEDANGRKAADDNDDDSDAQSLDSNDFVGKEGNRKMKNSAVFQRCYSLIGKSGVWLSDENRKVCFEWMAIQTTHVPADKANRKATDKIFPLYLQAFIDPANSQNNIENPQEKKGVTKEWEKLASDWNNTANANPRFHNAKQEWGRKKLRELFKNVYETLKYVVEDETGCEKFWLEENTMANHVWSIFTNTRASWRMINEVNAKGAKREREDIARREADAEQIEKAGNRKRNSSYVGPHPSGSRRDSSNVQKRSKKEETITRAISAATSAAMESFVKVANNNFSNNNNSNNTLEKKIIALGRILTSLVEKNKITRDIKRRAMRHYSENENKMIALSTLTEDEMIDELEDLFTYDNINNNLNNNNNSNNNHFVIYNNDFDNMEL